MLRILLSTLIPLLAPTVFFLAWLWLRNRYLVTHKGEAPPIEKGVWFWLAAAGGLLTVLLFAVSAWLAPSGHPDDIYVPPQEVDGKIVPGHFVPRQDPAAR
jgi:hypothetical protein